LLIQLPIRGQSMQHHHDSIAVIDFGGQYAHLIATKVRNLHVLAEILQPDDPIEEFMKHKGIILSGSAALASFGEGSDYNKKIYELNIPIIGFCFGHQEIAKHYGGEVIHGKQEWGKANFHLTKEHPLFSGLSNTQQVWMSHSDSVVSLGKDFEELGYSVLGVDNEPHRFAAIASDKLKRYGFQYHPEVDDTLHGDEMIKNFVLKICNCQPTWTMENYLGDKIENIRNQVGSKSVFLLASGGVDSTVAAKLFKEALRPEQLQLLHVDTGLMRKNESKEVLSSFAKMGLENNLHFIDASEDFLTALDGIVEPEAKRKIIGTTFVNVFEREAKRLGLREQLLGQGTIYPDTIETGGTKRADVIKTHHNRVPIIEEMIAAGKVIEPLAELYKVEVRELGEKLNVPHDMIWRHPFPGPGFGVRLLCSDGKSDITHEELGALTNEINHLLSKYNLTGLALPMKSVGVKADLRSYEHPVLIMGRADWSTLQEASGMIFKKVSGINRCIWNLGPNTPKEFKLRQAAITFERLELLREVDAIVMDTLRRHGMYDDIWQCPTVLVPIEIDGVGEELCIVRPVNSERGMTASAAQLPSNLLNELRDKILPIQGISGLAYDLTSKPPATIEWE
jgi:GMP synthase (glutamine-hydrolysing)